MTFKKSTWSFVLIAVAFFGLFFIVETNNDKFLLNDFKVYYYASEAQLDGKPPYDEAYGLTSGFYKYSPVTLYLFAPYHLFSFEVAMKAHFIFTSIFSIGVFFLCLRLCSAYFGRVFNKTTGFLALLLLLSVVHLTRELHMGNINMFLIFFFLMAIFLMHERKRYQAAFCWVLIIFFKPYFLILMLPVFIAKDWKLMLIMTGFGISFLFIPALFVGLDGNFELLRDWFGTMSQHNAGGFSEHTFSSIFTAYSGVRLESSAQYIFIGLTGITYLVIRSRELFGKKLYSHKSQLFDLFILMAIVPNLVITDSQHFLFTLPLIALLLAYLKFDLRWYLVIPFVVFWFFYGANANDLLGNPLSNLFDTYSTIGVGNLGLILMLILIDRRFYSEKEIISSS